MTMTKIEPVDVGLKIQTTWHHRLVKAAAAKHGCEVSVRKDARYIGGRRTAKYDTKVLLAGTPLAIGSVVHQVTELIMKLNVGSDKYAASLPTDLSPTRRKIERRRWLEQQAAKEAERLLSGGG